MFYILFINKNMILTQYQSASVLAEQIEEINTELEFISSSACQRYPMSQLAYRDWNYDYRYNTEILPVIISSLESDKASLVAELLLISGSI